MHAYGPQLLAVRIESEKSVGGEHSARILARIGGDRIIAVGGQVIRLRGLLEGAKLTRTRLVAQASTHAASLELIFARDGAAAGGGPV